ncbi:MAG: hypothetical protein JSR44_06890 [Spirochaetes bacterium]|nr:hypothetical protein [Spirochaetota bacterium]
MLKKRVPVKLRELIRKFQINKDNYYKTSDYKETEVRVEFLNPLLCLLGWDVDNQAGYNRDGKDVIHEKFNKANADESEKDKKQFFDYVFKIGSTGKFLLEAKRPNEKIEEDKNSAFQIRKYGHQNNSDKMIKIGILSNFEEFAIYECSTEPQQTDSAGKSRLFYCRFEEYPQYFNFLYGFLSKEAVMTGLHDKIFTDFQNIIKNVEKKEFVSEQFSLLYSVFESVTEKQLISVMQDSEIPLNSSNVGDDEGKEFEVRKSFDSQSTPMVPKTVAQVNAAPIESFHINKIISDIKDFKSEVLGEVGKLQQQIANEAREKSLTAVEAEARIKLESEKFVSITNNFKSEVLGEIIKLQQHISNEAQTKSLATVVVQDNVKAENEKEYLLPKDFRDEILGEIVKLQQYITSEARKETPATALTHAHLKIENEKIFSIIKDFKSEIQGEIVKLQRQISSETQERAQALFLAHERINRRNESSPSKGQDMSRQPVFYLSPILPLQQMH